MFIENWLLIIENLREYQVKIKNIQVNYKVFGEGSSSPSFLDKKLGLNKSFLILHGWPSNSSRWQRVAEALSSKFLVIIPDLPGFGKSQEPEKPWSLDDYVEWLYEFSEKIPELRGSFFLLGHSFGGALSAKFSIRHNQKIKKLFLVSASCIRKNTAIKKVFYRVSKIVKLFSFLPYYQHFRRAIYKFIIKKSDYPYQSGVMKETYLKVILDDLSHKIGFLRVPVIIIWGQKDNLTSISQAYFIKNKILNSNLIVIPEADHSLNTKIPEILAQKILENA